MKLPLKLSLKLRSNLRLNVNYLGRLNWQCLDINCCEGMCVRRSYIRCKEVRG